MPQYLHTEGEDVVSATSGKGVFDETYLVELRIVAALHLGGGT